MTINATERQAPMDWCVRCSPDRPSPQHDTCKLGYTRADGIERHCGCPYGHEFGEATPE